MNRAWSSLPAWPIFAVACGQAGAPVLQSDMPLHLEDHLDAATFTGSELPPDPPPTVEWRFDRAQPEWKAAPAWNPTIGNAELAATGEALRVTLSARTRNRNGIPAGGMYVDVPGWNHNDLADLWDDRLAFRNVNAQHPDLVQKYTAVLEKQWEAHQLLALARRFKAGAQIELTPEQLQTRRALGYIR